jgi:hypothetical protein
VIKVPGPAANTATPGTQIRLFQGQANGVPDKSVGRTTAYGFRQFRIQQ